MAGLVLVLVTWLVTLRTVFTPRESSSHTALWIARLVGYVMLAIGRGLPPSAREDFLGFASPLMLLLECILLLSANIVGFALISWGSRAPLVAGFVALRSATDVLSAFAWISGMLLLAAVVTHLVCVTSAYNRRERLVCQLSAQATHSLDAENLLVEYIREEGGFDRLGNLFGLWSSWLADVHFTHLAYPALIHHRSGGDVCWSEAAQIILDCAALAEACLPRSTPPETGALLAEAERCFPKVAGRIGIELPPVLASFQGREAFPFHRTLALIRDAGVRVERGEVDAQDEFQRMRVSYAPFTNAICERLMCKYGEQ